MPNLLQEFEGDVLISGPTPMDPKFDPVNLITNFESRVTVDDDITRPLIDALGNRATYESCFKASNVELGPEGDRMVVEIDLGRVAFVHAIVLM